MPSPAEDLIVPRSNRADAIDVVKRLRDAGHVAYFAGGCVRDQLLGLQPKDYDVATDAPPARVRSLFGNTQAVGAAFGVILVRHRKSVIEVATFRTDLKYSDGRRPEGVVFTTAEQDAQRRDFTINGLFYDPIEDRVIDYVGGQEDLKKKVLRAIGEPNHRFEEDHLRLLRAVRFAARFDLTIDVRTAQAMLEHAPELARISPERIAEELRQMLTTPTRVPAWRLLWNTGLLTVILRSLPERSDRPYEDRYSRALFPEIAPDSPQLPFGLAIAGLALCYRVSGTNARSARPLLIPTEVRRAVRACRTTLKISNDEAEMMTDCLAVGAFLFDEPPTVAKMKRFLAGPHSPKARLLLDGLKRSDFDLCPRIEWLQYQFTIFEQTDFAPEPLITGDDLLAAGLTPGPLFKRVLDATYDAQLEDRVKTRDEALALALNLAQAM